MFTVTRIMFMATLAATIVCMPIAGQQPLRDVPGDCLVCVQINNLDESVNKLEQFLAGLGPEGLVAEAKAELGELLANPRLEGVRTDGTFFILLSPPKGKPEDSRTWYNSIRVLIPTKDFKAMTSNMDLDPADPNGLRGLSGTGIGLVEAGRYALLGPKGQALVDVARSIRSGPDKPLASRLDSQQLAMAASPGIWIFLDVQGLAKVLGPGIADRIKQIGSQISEQMGPNGTQLGPIFAMYAGMAEFFLGQVEQITLAVKADPQMLSLTKYVRSIPGSQLAQAFDRTGPRKPWRFLGYCEDGAVFAGISRLPLARFADLQTRLLQILSGSWPDTPKEDQINRMLAASQVMQKAVGEQMAFSLSTRPGVRPGFCVKQIWELKDKQAFTKAQDHALDLFGPGGMLSNLPGVHQTSLEVEKLPDLSYNNTQIQGQRFRFRFKDPNLPEATAIAQIYGNGLEMRTAAVDQVQLTVFGADAQQVLQQMIDQASSGGPSRMPSEIKAAMDIAPGAKDADVLVTFSIPRLMGMGINMVMPMMPQQAFQGTSSIVLTISADKGNLTGQLVLPKSHLMEIANLVKGIQQGGPAILVKPQGI